MNFIINYPLSDFNFNLNHITSLSFSLKKIKTLLTPIIIIMSLDHDLKVAARNGDAEFLRNYNKPPEYYLAQDEEGNNILHIVVVSKSLDFIKQAFKLLSVETIQILLLQTQTQTNLTPLHLAAATGNVELVKLFLDVYRSTPSLPPLNQRPWLLTDEAGCTPCFQALAMGHQECGLEIWKMDTELLSNTIIYDGEPLLPLVVRKGHNKWGLEILRSPFSVNCTTSDGFTALHFVAHCSSGGEEICKELLKKYPELIKQKSKVGLSLIQYWVGRAKLWPFECLLKNIDTVPDGRKHLVELISATEYTYCQNVFHSLAAEETVSDECSVEIAKLLIHTYKDELASSQVLRISEELFPWLMEDNQGWTPLQFAIVRKKEIFVKLILSEDNNALLKVPNALLLAIQKGCHEVAEMIMDIVDHKGWTDLLIDDQQVNALHLAPFCTRNLYERLLIQHPQLLEKVDSKGATVLHSWVQLGEVWPFEYVLRSEKFDRKKKSQLVKLISSLDFELKNPLHVAANSTNEGTYQIVKFLVEAYTEENPTWSSEPWCTSLPWFSNDTSYNGCLNLAIRNQPENLALYILSLFHNPISELLEHHQPAHKTLFLAIEMNCFQVAREILTKLDKGIWSKYVTDFSNGQTIFHLLPHCKDQTFGRWIVEEAPLELITQENNKGEIPLDEASDIGAAWIIQAMLEKDPSVFNKAPLAWVKACENGHISAIRVFIDYYPGKFSDHCIQHHDSPLHHIKLRNLTSYEEFLDIPRMKDLINVQDFQGATPLHKAIQNKNIFLTEALLNMDKIKYNIKDYQHQKTAKDLLLHLYKEQVEWRQMCGSIGFDPTIKTTYFQHKSNLLDVRNTLALVAALLATITFTAGFTLPGGLDQNTGEAMLVKKAAFAVFLLSDTLAMCCSMLILIFLVWSMVYDPNKSLVLIDRSMKLLLISLYSTLIAFMAGVYMVVSPKSLWSAIVVIVMCSFIGVLANMNWLYKVRDKLFRRADEEDSSHKQPLLEQLEEGFSRDENDRLLVHPEESSQGLELGEIRVAN